jgi:hypothetical protein
MDDLNLGSDESIIKKIPRIIINGIRHEAILTSRRFVILEAETGRINREISYSDIVLAVMGMNTLREPTIRLTFITPEGKERRTEELIFVHSLAGQNIIACDACMDILKEHKVPVRISTHFTAGEAGDRSRRANISLSGGVTSTGRPQVPDFSPFGAAYNQRQAPDGEPKGISLSPLTIAAGIILILVVIAGVIVLGGAVNPKSPEIQKPLPAATHPDTTPAHSPVPSPTPPVTATASPVSEISIQPKSVPDNGIWIRIAYPGNYSGSLKADGWNSIINSTGMTDYQLPVQNSLIEGVIEKLDGSGDRMTVGIYNGGTLISEQTTKKPHGMIDLHLTVGPALGGTAITPAPAPVIVVPTPDTSLVLHQVPQKGIWTRVSYPGYFTGSITGNGFTTEVNSSGDQFYQLSMSSGTIEGNLGKGDGSLKNLVIQVYKDGALVTALNTSRPRGVVDFQTIV